MIKDAASRAMNNNLENFGIIMFWLSSKILFEYQGAMRGVYERGDGTTPSNQKRFSFLLWVMRKMTAHVWRRVFLHTSNTKTVAHASL